MSTKIPCEAIQDLLILYDDDACSEVTRKLVEEHLAECEKCRKGRLTEIVAPILEPPAERGIKAAKNSFKKMRNRWIASVLTLLMLFPLTAVGVLGYNEVTGKGRAFTNWDEIQAGEEFLNLIAEGKYEEAVENVSFHDDYVSLLEKQSMTADEYVEEQMSIYEPITLGEEEMIWNKEVVLAVATQNGDITQNGDVDWLASINSFPIFFPEDFFLEIINNYTVTETEDGEYIYTVELSSKYDTADFYRTETLWGTYILSEQHWTVYNEWLAEAKSEQDFTKMIFETFDVIPKSLYEAYCSEVELKHLQWYNRDQDYYHFLLDEGEEAFHDIYKPCYAKELEEKLRSEKITFKEAEFDSIRKVDGEWVITYLLTFEKDITNVGMSFNQVIETYTASLNFKAYKGKVSYLDYNYIPSSMRELTVLNISEALKPDGADCHSNDFGFRVDE